MSDDYAQKGLDVKIVGSKDDLKQHLLINTDELLIPLADFSCPFPGIVRCLRVGSRKWLALMMFTVFKDLRMQDVRNDKATMS